MIKSREDLHEQLCDALGSRNVYYQPPASVRLKYPAIIYHKSNIYTKHADDTGYLRFKSYQIIHVGNDPDDPVLNKILDLPGSTFNRQYTSDNLYHDVFTITI